MSTQTIDQDPWKAALDAKEPPNLVYGEVLFDMWFCALVKGQGKVPFDPAQHSPGQRRTCVKVGIYPLAETGMTFAIEREFIAEGAGDGWLKETLPSLRALNVDDLKKVNGAYAKVELVKYGTYDKNGETRNLTAPKFLALYSDQATCLSAWEADRVNGYEPSGQGVAAINEELGTPGANGSNGHDKERDTALAFLPAIIRGCRHANPNEGIDVAKLEGQLTSNVLLKKYFTITSPEVQEAVAKVLAEPPF